MKKFGAFYLAIAIIFSIYGNWWGNEAYKGYAYNFGKSLIWPAIIFPALGEIIGGIILIGVVILVMATKRSS